MNKQKPINLNFLTIKFPINAIVSILHRLSGVFLFIVIPLLLWCLNKSLISSEDFDNVIQYFHSPMVRLISWIVLAALAYHLLAGIRHLIMDWGIGDTLRGGRIGAQLILLLFAIFVVLLGVWLW